MKKYFIFLLCAVFSVNIFAATHAEIKNQVNQAYYQWCAAIGKAKGNPSVVTKYYAPGAILVPTLSHKILRNKNHGLDEYFTHLTSHENIKCTPEKNYIHIHGHTVVNSGLYDFSYQDGNERKLIPSRFTFVYEKIGGKWMIVNHHSSKMPE